MLQETFPDYETVVLQETSDHETVMLLETSSDHDTVALQETSPDYEAVMLLKTVSFWPLQGRNYCPRTNTKALAGDFGHFNEIN